MITGALRRGGFQVYLQLQTLLVGAGLTSQQPRIANCRVRATWPEQRRPRLQSSCLCELPRTLCHLA